MSLQQQCKRNVLSNSGANAVGAVLQLVALAVLSQCLGTGDYAIYLVATAIVGVAEIGSDFGTRIWAVQKFALSPKPATVLANALLSKLCYSMCTAAVLAIFLINEFGAWGALLCALIAMTQPGTDPLLWYLRGMERLDIEAIVVLTARFVTAIAMIVLAVAGYGVFTILVAWLLCNLARMIVECQLPYMQPLFPCHAKTTQLPLTRLREVLLSTFPMGGALLCMSLFHRFGVLLLSQVGTDSDVALFGTGYKYVSASSFVATSIAVALFPKLVKAIHNRDETGTNGVIQTEVMMITAIFGPACILGILILPVLSQWVYSGNLSNTGWIMAALMPGLYMSSINIGTKFTLNAMSLNWPDTMSVVMGLMGFVIVFFTAAEIPICYRAALAWGSGEATMFVSRVLVLRMLRRNVDLHVPVVTATFLLLIATVIWR